ncbi:MAG: GTP 3',8-cyclase MoaA [Maricaulaceae bacterium]
MFVGSGGRVIAPSPPRAPPHAPLIDPFARRIRYVRLSVTDRCDLRCVYCMAERMTFLPKTELLSFEELDRLCAAFIDRGVSKIRVTGGEPLVRRDIPALIETLGARIRPGGLEELTLTTNATQLEAHAETIARASVKRINVSVDSLDPATFARVTRGGDLAKTLAGIDAAQSVGLAVKLNVVALKSENADQLVDMTAWAHARGLAITFIEVMPMGETGEDRVDQFYPLTAVREALAESFALVDLAKRTGGPARYVRAEETGGEIGFITPLTHNFCEGCNRVRVDCTGKLYPCLGQEGVFDLRPALREGTQADLHAALDAAIAGKPKGHDFVIDRGRVQGPARTMSATGG